MSALLSRSDFDALADGGGGPEVIERLRTGVRSRHAIMIAALMELAEALPADETSAANLSDGFELLSTVQSTAPEAASVLLAHPHTGMWLARCLVRLQGRRESARAPLHAELGRLTAIGAAAAIRAGRRFELAVPMWDGTVLLPTLGLATLGGPGEFGTATVRCTPAGTEITGAGRRVLMPAAPAEDSPGWQGTRRLVSVSGGRPIEIEVEDLDPDTDLLGRHKPLAGRLDSDRLARWQATLDDAWAILVQNHGGRAAELAVGLTTIVPAEPEPGASGSVTSRYGFGSVVMSLPDDGELMADTLIHEFQHSKLYALMEQIPLYRSQPRARHYSPWREDPRPFGGILQGAYAYIGVTDFWNVQRSAVGKESHRLADHQFARWRGQVARAVDMMLDSGRLTDAGELFVRTMGAHAEGWLGLDVPEPVQRLAEITVADHYLTWRLQNMTVDRETASRLALAQSEGAPCPIAPTAVPTRLVTEPEPWPLSRLQQLAYREMRPGPAAAAETGSAAAGPATAADAALLRGENALATKLYLEEIAARPGDVMTWAALCQAIDDRHPAKPVLTGTPEVVYAVHHAALAGGATPPAPLMLAEWLAGADRTVRKKADAAAADRQA